MKRQTIASIFIIGLVVGEAVAGQSPTLPSTAQKLTGPEIIDLYSRKALDFENYTKDQSLVGIADFDFTSNKMGGRYDYGHGQDKGNWSGTVRLEGDLLCMKSGQEEEACVSVYKDETMIYETNSKGVVTSTHKL